MTQFTKGPWKVEHMGGASTVLVSDRPRYNNTATPAYGYRDNGPFCVATIFQEDSGHIRRDFVTFSHNDAHLIAAAPELYEALDHLVKTLDGADVQKNVYDALMASVLTLAKARGEA